NPNVHHNLQPPYNPTTQPPYFRPPSLYREQFSMKTQGHQQDVLFLSGTRTGFGSFGGTLKDLSAIDLGVVAAKVALERAKVEPGQVDHVVFGNALQTSADAIYMARHVALKSGLPIETPAVTVNRLCGSGFESIIQGAQ